MSDKKLFKAIDKIAKFIDKAGSYRKNISIDTPEKRINLVLSLEDKIMTCADIIVREPEILKAMDIPRYDAKMKTIAAKLLSNKLGAALLEWLRQINSKSFEAAETSDAKLNEIDIARKDFIKNQIELCVREIIEKIGDNLEAGKSREVSKSILSATLQKQLELGVLEWIKWVKK